MGIAQETVQVLIHQVPVDFTKYELAALELNRLFVLVHGWPSWAAVHLLVAVGLVINGLWEVAVVASPQELAVDRKLVLDRVVDFLDLREFLVNVQQMWLVKHLLGQIVLQLVALDRVAEVSGVLAFSSKAIIR